MNRNNNNRLVALVGIGILIVIIIAVVSHSFKSKPSVLQASKPAQANVSANGGNGTVKPEAEAPAHSTVPWDYKIEEAKVGDLIGGDMAILPDNKLLPNDGNYATGDQVWILSYMNAEMSASPDGRNDVKLSAWEPLKSYRTKDDAQKDMANLKLEIKTDVDLVGVYKTEYQGKFRQYALLTLPSGHTIKQPVPEDRYNSLKDKKQVKVVLEEVHDFADYDLAMSKFRGWAD